SSSTASRSASRRSYRSPHTCSPSDARTSSTVTRRRFPPRRTLPVTNRATRSARAAASGSAPLCRKRCTAARDFTASRGSCPSRAMSSSVSPSARYASAVSADRLSKYSTATLLGAGAVEAWDVRRHAHTQPLLRGGMLPIAHLRQQLFGPAACDGGITHAGAQQSSDGIHLGGYPKTVASRGFNVAARALKVSQRQVDAGAKAVSEQEPRVECQRAVQPTKGFRVPSLRVADPREVGERDRTVGLERESSMVTCDRAGIVTHPLQHERVVMHRLRVARVECERAMVRADCAVEGLRVVVAQHL